MTSSIVYIFGVREESQQFWTLHQADFLYEEKLGKLEITAKLRHFYSVNYSMLVEGQTQTASILLAVGFCIDE